MPINIPLSNIGIWGAELVSHCLVSVERRRRRGMNARNLYLTGSEAGAAQTYRKTYAYIQTLSSLLYSPAELRLMTGPYGPAGPRERAMGRAAGGGLLEHMRAGDIDTMAEMAVEWALVKGKTFLKLDWTRRGFQASFVQPESIGVAREDLTSLDAQDFFVHTYWLTDMRFADLIQNLPNRRELVKAAARYLVTIEGMPPESGQGMPVMIGGQLYPYRPQGTPGGGQGRNLVDWMSVPAPEMAPQVRNKMIRIDELFVWDRRNDDWAVFLLVGNEPIAGGTQIGNLFASGERLVEGRRPESDRENPLTGHHPFVEFCPNPMPDYFWGWPETMNIAALQLAINDRVDGINKILRREEDPPRVFSGISGNVSQLKKRLDKPGGWHVESTPGFKQEALDREVPAGLWQSLHEYEQMFDTMGGFPPVMQGQGESGVRAQGHAETLVRMASPRFRDRALTVERDVERLGGLALDLLRARCADMFPYWVKKSQLGPFAGKELSPEVFEAPAPDLVALPMRWSDIPDRFKVTVDGHSSSPAFSQDTLKIAMALAQRGALSPEELVRQLHPVNEEEIIADMETRNAEKAAMIASLPPAERAAALTGHRPSGGRKH